MLFLAWFCRNFYFSLQYCGFTELSSKIGFYQFENSCGILVFFCVVLQFSDSAYALLHVICLSFCDE